MTTDRRQFLERIALGAASLGGAGTLTALTPLAASASPARGPAADEWDVSWAQRITGRHRAVFDVPEIESGYGVWRATIWQNQYRDVLGAASQDTFAVLVLRHNAVALAMRPEYWAAYAVGKSKKVTHPETQKSTTRNPVMLSSSRGEISAHYDGFALDQALSRGTITLACDLALQDCALTIQRRDGGTLEAAHEKAKSFLVPGVILQPSGVFAVFLAQQAGCMYIRAS